MLDDEALRIAKSVVEGKAYSYVAAAHKLAQYIIDLNEQVDAVEKLFEQEISHHD